MGTSRPGTCAGTTSYSSAERSRWQGARVVDRCRTTAREPSRVGNNAGCFPTIHVGDWRSGARCISTIDLSIWSAGVPQLRWPADRAEPPSMARCEGPTAEARDQDRARARRRRRDARRLAPLIRVPVLAPKRRHQGRPREATCRSCRSARDRERRTVPRPHPVTRHARAPAAVRGDRRSRAAGGEPRPPATTHLTRRPRHARGDALTTARVERPTA